MPPNKSHTERLLNVVGQRKEKNGPQKQKTRPSQSSSSSLKPISRSKKQQKSTSNTEEISQPQLADSQTDSSFNTMNTYTSPYNMNMSPLSMMQYGYPSMGYGMNSIGPLSTINQYLFSFQSFIFAIGQAVQIVGMNTHQLHQLYDQLTAMADQALLYIHEMKTLSIQEVATKNLSDEERRRRRRLKAIRWGLLFSASYASFWTILKWYKKRKDFKKRKHMIADGGEMFSHGNPNMHSRLPTLQSSPQHSIGMNMTSPPSMYAAQSNYGYGYSQPHQQYYY